MHKIVIGAQTLVIYVFIMAKPSRKVYEHVDKLIKFVKAHNGDLPRRRSEDGYERYLAAAYAALKGRCFRSPGGRKWASVQILTPSEARYFNTLEQLRQNYVEKLEGGLPVEKFDVENATSEKAELDVSVEAIELCRCRLEESVSETMDKHCCTQTGLKFHPFHTTFESSSDTRLVLEVEREIFSFRAMVQLWQEDPIMRGNVKQRFLIAWEDIPTLCGFRVFKPKPCRRPATHTDKLRQQQKYTKCRTWASECGLTEDEFISNLKKVPKEHQQRGLFQLPVLLRAQYCTVWEHARLLCVATAIRKAAEAAGGRLGGRIVAIQAVGEVLELLSFYNHRHKRLLEIPQRWYKVLSLSADSDDMHSGIKSLPGFVEMWLRDQVAALMSQTAQENCHLKTNTF